MHNGTPDPDLCPSPEALLAAAAQEGRGRRQIAAVSDALGFPHQSHFATTFRPLVGMTPRA
jgi:AraC-like DNA-binding protein